MILFTDSNRNLQWNFTQAVVEGRPGTRMTYDSQLLTISHIDTKEAWAEFWFKEDTSALPRTCDTGPSPHAKRPRMDYHHACKVDHFLQRLFMAGLFERVMRAGAIGLKTEWCWIQDTPRSPAYWALMRVYA